MSLVPANTPFNYNLGVDYETWENGRTGRSISADLGQIGQYFKLVRTYHDAAVGVPPGSAPTIDPTEAEAITYIVNHPGMQLVMGTNNNAVAQGGPGTWTAGLMTNTTDTTYTDQWVQMIITAFGSVANVKASLAVIQIGNELDSNGPAPNDPAFSSYQGWINTSLANLATSLANAGLGSIPVSTTIANYPSTAAANPIAFNTTDYIIKHWSANWNSGTPMVFFNQYTQNFGQSTDYQYDINYFTGVSTSLGSTGQVAIGETGYSTFYGQANQQNVYGQIVSWLNGQYTSSKMTVPTFLFDAFDQPSVTGWDGQLGIFAQSATYVPNGLKTGITLPAWSATPIDTQTAGSTNGVMYSPAPDASFLASPGNDTVVASSGTNNRLIFWADAQSFAVSIAAGQQALTVHDNSGNHGTDSIFNIQFLQYADQTVDLTSLVKAASQPADKFAAIIELYGAYLDRAPDAMGLHYWVARSGEGMSLGDIAKSFYLSAEAVAHRPVTHGAGELVTAAYQDALGRAPDAAGLAYWTAEVQSGHIADYKLPLALVLGALASGAGSADALFVANHVAVGAHFALDQGLNDLAQARAVAAATNSTAASVTAANQLTDTYAAAAATADTAELVLKLVGIADQIHV
jgi:hypothetical protein